MLNVCETILTNIENHFKQSKRTNAELSDKLHELFENNSADFDKFAQWYDPKTPRINIYGKMEYEHYVIENFKKSVYGDNYVVKEYKPP